MWWTPGLAPGGVRNYGRGAGYRRRDGDGFALILAMRLLHQISQLRHKPPLTLALMAGMSALHLRPDLFEGVYAVGNGIFDRSWGDSSMLRNVCLLPASIFDVFRRTGGLEIRRLLVSPFVHGSDLHLYFNMASFLLKGVSLEPTMGIHAYAGLLAFSLVASQLLMLVFAWVLMVAFDDSSAMQSCTVGFSGVLFALKYVLSRRSPREQTVLGFKVNTRYATWLELVLISILVPNASFLGHLCGILAGVLYVEVPFILRILNLLSGVTLHRSARGPSYTYSSGTASGPSSGRNGGPSYTYSSGTASGPSSGRNGSGAGGQGSVSRSSETDRQRQRQQQQQQQDGPSSQMDAGVDADIEDADLQEALRLSLQNSREDDAFDGQQGSTTFRSNGGSVSEAAATENVGHAPTAPPLEEPLVVDISSEGHSRTAHSAAIDQNELRRRRLQRLGGGR